ncbi:MAG: hypothetical protein ACR2N2_01215 [Acidimicrobiia bacterium]
MASKEKLVQMSVEATGDDEILVAGDFQPKGMTWKRAAGAAAGSLAGGAVSGGDSWAQAAGAAGGMAVGTLASAGKGVPPVVVLAATPTKLYILATKMGQATLLARHLEVLHVLDRDDLAVTLKKRATVRTAIIEDEATGERFELEGVKFGFHHMNDLLNELDEAEHGEAEAESDARIAAGEAAAAGA